MKKRIKCAVCQHPEAEVGSASGDGRPEYRCTKCGHSWTNGLTSKQRKNRAAETAEPTEGQKSLARQVRDAQKEVESWTPERRANLQLEGHDPYAVVPDETVPAPKPPPRKAAKTPVIHDPAKRNFALRSLRTDMPGKGRP
jgi:hypothetical protein